ncbi:hypothetical protein HNR19_002004 [Nocardioides thalensis]|uniref:Uncharacterized protein n=1 Tax=Nocardioides thalensis TaxID=1914755 RepID=A0A853C2R6_9ACTN|nr:hypothetical protein [Nocardioides thalensis]NYJ01306.1 hypothetical protein [Nocardioides thalensis]
MRLVTLALAVLPAVMSASLLAPASAETVSDSDPRHDVVRYDADTLDDEGTPVSGKARVDMVRHRFSYGGKRIRVVLRLNDLRRTKRVTWLGVPLQWNTNGEFGYAEMGVVFRRNGPAKGRGWFESGDADDCTVDHDVDFRADRVRVAIPATCLGSPPAIRAYAIAYTVTNDSIFVDTSPDNPLGGTGVRIKQG